MQIEMTQKPAKFGRSLPDLGERVRIWRVAGNMTQAELEVKAGLSHNTISRIECGNVSPRLDTIERIASALKISVEQLHFQSPETQVEENQSPYGLDDATNNLLKALSKVPEPKRSQLLKTFMELIRITLGDIDA
jgi:transcriptional regulator with XRE-family HTH domain